MARAAVLAFTLLATTASAHDGSGAVAPESAPAASASAVALYTLSATLVSIASAGASGLGGAALPTIAFDATGRPQPLALAGGFVLAAGLHFTLVHLVVPELTRFANVDGFRGEVTAARAEGWRVSRWAAFTALGGLGALAIGAGVEQVSFSSGQWAMLAGVAVTLVAGVVWTVLDAVFSWSGFVESRKAVR